uniref:Uncharacterized protein n=1 Tax=Oryza sativa subsp. japonica TaxID=39947 RepID=Q6K6I9_ORYSJ|nr:hypothetical protein [Oryza sativa Japonica Group]BAD21971.1 hypothetical protein [Oryza sativa Japonica Group]
MPPALPILAAVDTDARRTREEINKSHGARVSANELRLMVMVTGVDGDRLG